MASSRTKGSSYERELHVALLKAGWLVHRAYPSLKRSGKDGFFSLDQDVFGVFDLIATRPEGGVHWIQVTTDKKATARRRKMELFLNQLGRSHPIRVCSILALRYPGKKWRFQSYDTSNTWFDVTPYGPAINIYWVSKKDNKR